MRHSLSVICGVLTTASLSVLAYGQSLGDAGSISVSGQKEKEYYKLAKVSMVEAIEAANSKVAGRAVEAELDDERGFLVYDVKVIADDGTTHKVVVDAGDKRVLRQRKD